MYHATSVLLKIKEFYLTARKRSVLSFDAPRNLRVTLHYRPGACKNGSNGIMQRHNKIGGA